MIDTIKDLADGAQGLKDWFKSQDVEPSDSVLIVEFFLAAMIAENMKSVENFEEKMELIDHTIRRFVMIFERCK